MTTVLKLATPALEPGLDVAWATFQRQISTLEAEKKEFRERCRRLSRRERRHKTELLSLRRKVVEMKAERDLLAQELRSTQQLCEGLQAFRIGVLKSRERGYKELSAVTAVGVAAERDTSTPAAFSSAGGTGFAANTRQGVVESAGVLKAQPHKLDDSTEEKIRRWRSQAIVSSARGFHAVGNADGENQQGFLGRGVDKSPAVEKKRARSNGLGNSGKGKNLHMPGQWRGRHVVQQVVTPKSDNEASSSSGAGLSDAGIWVSTASTPTESEGHIRPRSLDHLLYHGKPSNVSAAVSVVEELEAKFAVLVRELQIARSNSGSGTKPDM